MGGFYVHGRQRDFLLTDDLASFYGNGPAAPVTDVADYYNRPDPDKQGNRRERRARAAQKRRKKK
jgi:hypothetical protein